jgi:hypothetical protein
LDAFINLDSICDMLEYCHMEISRFDPVLIVAWPYREPTRNARDPMFVANSRIFDLYMTLSR